MFVLCLELNVLLDIADVWQLFNTFCLQLINLVVGLSSEYILACLAY